MISSIIATIVSLFIYYFIGSLFLWGCKIKHIQDSFTNVFVSTLLGFVSCSAFYSIIKTTGNTISWGFFLVFLIFLTYRRAKNKSLVDSSLRKAFVMTRTDIYCWLTILSTSVIFIIANGFFFYGTPFNFEPHFDYSYYAAVADEMARRGIESNNIMRDVLWQNKITPTPYHYIELWATSMISQAFKINSTETIFIVIYSILGTLFVTGVIALARQYRNNLHFYVIAVFAIFYVPVAYFDYTSGMDIFKVLNLGTIFTSLINTKTLIVALFFTFSIVLYKYDTTYFLISLLLLPFVNIVLAPSIFVAVGWILLYQSIRGIKPSLFILAETIVLAVFILCFYVLQSQSDSLGNFSAQNIEENIHNWLSIVKSTIKLVLFFLIYHAPIALIALYYWRKDKKAVKNLINRNGILLIVTSILLVTGFLFSQLTKGVRDNTQFYALTTEILPIVYSVYAFEIMTLSGKKWERLTIIAFCIFFFAYSLKYNTFQVKNPNPFSIDNQFLAEVENVVKQNNNKIVASFDDVYTYPYPISSQTDINLRTVYIGERNIHTPIPSTFTAFCDNYEKSHGKTTLDTLQYEFLITNSIKQIVSNQAIILPSIIETLIDTTYTSIDDRIFIVLK